MTDKAKPATAKSRPTGDPATVGATGGEATPDRAGKNNTHGGARGAGTEINMERAMKNGNEAVTAGYQRLIDLSNENAEAFIASGTIAASGAEEIGRTMLASVKTSLADVSATSTALLGCKDPKEWADLQGREVSKLVDRWFADAAKLAELSVKVVVDAWAPLSERVKATAGTITKTP